MGSYIQKYWSIFPIGLVCGALYILSYFGRMRMGMMRYLVFTNRELQDTFLGPPWLQVHLLILMSLFILSAIGLWRVNTHRPSPAKNILIPTMLICTIAALWVFSLPTQQLLIYGFGSLGWIGLAWIFAVLLLLKWFNISKNK